MNNNKTSQSKTLHVRKVNGSYSTAPKKGINPPKFNESRTKKLDSHRKMPAEASATRQGKGNSSLRGSKG